MKKVTLLFLMLFGAIELQAQLNIQISANVFNIQGVPYANQTVMVVDSSSNPVIPPTVTAYTTNANGTFTDTITTIASSGDLHFITMDSCLVTTTVIMPYVSTTVSLPSASFVLCNNGSGSGNCNYSVSALPVAGFPNRAFFSYTGGGPGIQSYLWDFGDGNTSNQPNPFHTYAQPGTYYYCLTIDACAPVCDSITVFGGGGCDPYFFPVVNGNTVDIFPSLLTGQFEVIVDWGDGQLDTFTPQNIPVLPANISHTYSASGNYSICFTHSNASLGCSRTYCDSVSVNTGSSPCQALWTVDTLNSINFAGNVMLWNLSTGGSSASSLDYIWDWGDGTTSTGPYPMHTYSDTGIYFVCLTIVDPVSGCTDTFCDSLGFDADGNLIYKNAIFTGFTVMVVDPATIGTEEINLDATVDVYPNPSDGDIFIRSEQVSPIDVSVLDLSGRMIQAVKNPNNPNGIIELNIAKKGMYIVQINTGAGSVTRKILID